MSIEKLKPAFTFTEDRIAELRAVIPEAFADGKIDWDTLREVLGDYLEEDGADAEHFGLFWPGKRQARRLASVPSKGTLAPAPSEGVNEETTKNIFIEGDNLEVLKLLQKSYAGRVKMIYIDPPYNTGKDFIYPDDYIATLDTYLVSTGQKDGTGAILTTNPSSSGRYHSTWLSMMYPRLLLARNLLRDDGVIFVSIDDHEFHNLRMIMHEIFGEENTVLIWRVSTNSYFCTQGLRRSFELGVSQRKANRFQNMMRRKNETIRPSYYENGDQIADEKIDRISITLSKHRTERRSILSSTTVPMVAGDGARLAWIASC